MFFVASHSCDTYACCHRCVLLLFSVVLCKNGPSIEEACRGGGKDVGYGTIDFRELTRTKSVI